MHIDDIPDANIREHSFLLNNVACRWWCEIAVRIQCISFHMGLFSPRGTSKPDTCNSSWCMCLAEGDNPVHVLGRNPLGDSGFHENVIPDVSVVGLCVNGVDACSCIVSAWKNDSLIERSTHPRNANNTTNRHSW